MTKVIEDLEYLDELLKIDRSFKDDKEVKTYFESPDFIFYLKNRYLGQKKIPVIFECQVNGTTEYYHIVATKLGIAMDWRFFAEIDPITAKDVENEKNVEKQRLLMMEYGINKYMTDVVIIDKHVGKNGRPGYGTLIECTILGERQRFMEFVNGTDCPPGLVSYLKGKKMLSDNGRKLYYHPVLLETATAREAVAQSFDVPVDWIHPDGWTCEA